MEEGTIPHRGQAPEPAAAAGLTVINSGYQLVLFMGMALAIGVLQ